MPFRRVSPVEASSDVLILVVFDQGPGVPVERRLVGVDEGVPSMRELRGFYPIPVYVAEPWLPPSAVWVTPREYYGYMTHPGWKNAVTPQAPMGSVSGAASFIWICAAPVLGGVGGLLIGLQAMIFLGEV